MCCDGLGYFPHPTWPTVGTYISLIQPKLAAAYLRLVVPSWVGGSCRIVGVRYLRSPSLSFLGVWSRDNRYLTAEIIATTLTILLQGQVLSIECSDAGRETTWGCFVKLGYRCQSAITGKWVNEFDEYRHSDFLWLPA